MFSPEENTTKIIRSQTCRKSTSGMKRAQMTSEVPSRRTSDSLIGQATNTTAASQPLGLKFVFKRQSGDKYEISSPLGSSATGDSHKKVKFSFDEEPENVDEQTKQLENETKHEEITFETSDLVEKDDELIAHILANQPRVKITHSIPFPIALVEDKTNIVHTKALLLIHLYKSFSSPCIMCVLCKCFFSINEFSKHFHLSDEDLLDEDDDDDEDNDEDEDNTNESISDAAKKKSHSKLNLEQRREKKLTELRKKSYKILPYCLNKNNELNEDQLKIWKIFGERYTQFKRSHTQSIALKSKTNTAELKSSMKKKIALDSSISKEKDKENKIDTVNWDYIDYDKKSSYLITRERLESEKIIFVNQSLAESAKKTTIDKEALQNKSDLHLSEEEDDEEETDDLEKEKRSSGKRLSPIESNSYIFFNMPTRIEKCFNYYENLSHDIRCFIESSPHVITPQSLISFNIKNRLRNYKVFLLSQQDRSFNLKWLCSSLDLQVLK